LVEVYHFYIDGRKLSGLELYLVYVTSFNELAVVEVAKNYFTYAANTGRPQCSLLHQISLAEVRGTQLFALFNTAFQHFSRESICAWI
jgi:hypothetical protein